MKKLLIAILIVSGLLSLSGPQLAQTTTVRTTLTTATTNTSGTETLVVGSTTGMTASTASTQNFLLIDGELMLVTAVPSATSVTVRRGQGGITSRHAASAEVRFGQGGRWEQSSGNASGVFLGNNSPNPSGSCTRASNQFLPVFKVAANGVVTAYDCPNSVSTTTGRWIDWQYYPGTSEVAAKTEPACQAGSTSSCTSYTALVSDYYIAITTEFTPDNATFTVTLPCSSVPAGKVWIVGYEGLGAGTTGNGVSIIGAVNTQQILTGITSRGYISNGTNCARLW